MRTSFLSAIWLFCLLPVLLSGQAADETPEMIGLSHKKGIKVAYHIKTSASGKDQICEGAEELRHLVRIYEEAGIAPADRNIHGIFDDDGAIYVLKDRSFAQLTKAKTNPNAALIESLIAKGVSIEVCGQRLKREGLSATDLLPGVKVLLSGQTRVIDLQLSGYAYFRF